MKRLDVVHHKCIMILLMVLVFVVGAFVGVRVSSIGTDSMLVMLFAFLLLHSMLLYVIFTQLVHLDDHVKRGKKK